jgi:RNA polymerase sigma factor (TIGR02999 family)
VSGNASLDVTGLLRAWSRGETGAADKLVPLVYQELWNRAARQLRRERDGTLRPTALVHEVYLRLAKQRGATWRDRAQFFLVAAQTMRRVLVDHARARGAAKRAHGWLLVTLDEEIAAPATARSPDVLALDAALAELAALDVDKARVVELRFFAGLTLEETAKALGVSESTITRNWRFAKAWLHRRLSADHPSRPPAAP